MAGRSAGGNGTHGDYYLAGCSAGPRVFHQKKVAQGELVGVTVTVGFIMLNLEWSLGWSGLDLTLNPMRTDGQTIA